MTPPKPRFELDRVPDDGSIKVAEIVPITALPLDLSRNRRGFLGVGLSAAAALGVLARSGVAHAAAGMTVHAEHPCAFAHGEPVLSLAMSPTGSLLVSGGGSDFFSGTGAVKLWGFPEGDVIRKLKKGTAPTQALAIAPNAKVLAVGSGSEGSGALRLYSLPGGAQIKRLGGDEGSVFAVAFSRDGKTLASVSGVNAAVRLWRLPDGKLLKTLPSGVVFGLAFNPSGRLLATAGADGFVRLWGLPDGELLEKVKGHDGSVPALAMSRDGKMLVSGGADGRIKLWSVPSLELVKAISAHSDRVRALAISRRGKVLASASFDGTVKLWHLPGGAPIRTLKGHSGKVSAVAFGRDGTTLVSAGHDKTIRVWDTSTGKERSCLIDLKVNPSTTKGATLKATSVHGRVVVYTLPCGSPIPPGATCTCNCVPGSIGVAPPPVPVNTRTVPGETRTQPCGTPIPPGFVCTCNCIPGSPDG